MKFLLWQTLCQTCRVTVVAHCVPNHCLCYYLPVSHLILICLCSCVTVYVLQCVTIWETRGVTSSDHNAPLHHLACPAPVAFVENPDQTMLQCVTVCYNLLQCVTMCYNVLQCVSMCYNVLQCVTMCYSVLQYGNWLSRQWLRLQATARQSPKLQQMQNTEIQK